MSLLLPRISFAPALCSPVRQPEIAPLFSLLDDAFAEAQRASRRTHRQMTQRRQEWRPRFDIKETADAYHVDAELPGVDPKDVAVEFLDDNTLSIKGRSERHTEKGTRPAASLQEAEAEAETEEASPTSGASTPKSETSSLRSLHATVEDEDASNAPLPSESSFQKAMAADAAPESAATKAVKVQEPTAGTVITKTEESPKEQYWFSERHIGSFQRQFAFPGRVDQEQIKASMKSGILSITVPKARVPETRRIYIE